MIDHLVGIVVPQLADWTVVAGGLDIANFAGLRSGLWRVAEHAKHVLG
jgi:hypothetical protein